MSDATVKLGRVLIKSLLGNVCFTPNCRHALACQKCPLRAKSGRAIRGPLKLGAKAASAIISLDYPGKFLFGHSQAADQPTPSQGASASAPLSPAGNHAGDSPDPLRLRLARERGSILPALPSFPPSVRVIALDSGTTSVFVVATVFELIPCRTHALLKINRRCLVPNRPFLMKLVCLHLACSKILFDSPIRASR